MHRSGFDIGPDRTRFKRVLLVVWSAVGALLFVAMMAPAEDGPEAIEAVGPTRAPTSGRTAPPLEIGPFGPPLVPSAFAAPPAPAPAEPRRARVVFTGDTLAHRGVVAQAATNAEGISDDYDFAPMFEQVDDILSDADIAICHLETPLSIDNTGLAGYPIFNVPRELADGLVTAGYDGCSYASNHSLDRGVEGVFETLTVLDEAGLRHAGAARSPAEYHEPTIYEGGGIAIASLSYSYGFNGFVEPSDTPWLVNQIDIDEIIDEVERARNAGAEYVVLSLHWGNEYTVDPTADQVELADRLAEDGGVDIVIGHHAHVVQPIDRVGDLPVVYGLGNFLSNQSPACCAVGSQDGVIVQVDIEEVPDDSGDPPTFDTTITFVPTWVDRSDFTIVAITDGMEGSDNAAVLERSRDRTVEAITMLGNAMSATEANSEDTTDPTGPR